MSFGTIIPASNIKDVLRQQDRWKNLYGELDSASAIVGNQLVNATRGVKFNIDKSNALLQREMSQNIMNAYQSAFDQKSAILESNLGQGYKSEQISDLDYALNNAYESYILNYQQNKLSNEAQEESQIAALESNAAKAQSQINQQRSVYDEALGQEAQYMSDYYKSVEGYLDWLYEKDELSSALEKQVWANKFTDSSGYMGGQMIGTNVMYDANGKLTDVGADIFNMLMSDPLSQQTDEEGNRYRGYSYQDYLVDTKQTDLANWLSDTSPYSTQSDTFNNMTYALRQLGITDINYSFVDDIKEATTPNEIVDVFNDNTDGPKMIVSGEMTNYYRGYDFGTIAVYPRTGESEQIIAFNELTLSDGLWGKVNDRNNESFTASYKDDAGTTRKYKLELTSTKDDAEARLDSTSKIYQKIDKSVGSIQKDKIYSYGNNIYVAVESKSGGLVLRKLQGSGDGKTYNDFVNSMINTKQWGNRLNTTIVKQGTTMTDGSIEKQIVKERQKQREEQREEQSKIDQRNLEHDTMEAYLKSGNSGHVQLPGPGYEWDYKTGRYIYNPNYIDPNRRR